MIQDVKYKMNKKNKFIFIFISVIVFLVLIELFFGPFYMILRNKEWKEAKQKYEELVKIGKLDIPQEGIDAVQFRSHGGSTFFIYFYPNDPDKTECRYFAVKHGKWRFKDNRTDEWIEE